MRRAPLASMYGRWGAGSAPVCAVDAAIAWVRGLQDKAPDVPLAVRGEDQIDAGLGQRDAGELDLAAPERAEAEVGANLAGAKDRLGAEGGILVDDKVLQGKAGDREQVEGDPSKWTGRPSEAPMLRATRRCRRLTLNGGRRTSRRSTTRAMKRAMRRRLMAAKEDSAVREIVIWI